MHFVLCDESEVACSSTTPVLASGLDAAAALCSKYSVIFSVKAKNSNFQLFFSHHIGLALKPSKLRAHGTVGKKVTASD